MQDKILQFKDPAFLMVGYSTSGTLMTSPKWLDKLHSLEIEKLAESSLIYIGVFIGITTLYLNIVKIIEWHKKGKK